MFSKEEIKSVYKILENHNFKRKEDLKDGNKVLYKRSIWSIKYDWGKLNLGKGNAFFEINANRDKLRYFLFFTSLSNSKKSFLYRHFSKQKMIYGGLMFQLKEVLEKFLVMYRKVDKEILGKKLLKTKNIAEGILEELENYNCFQDFGNAK